MTSATRSQRGAALAVALHVVLLAVVFAEAVFLAGRFRSRIDLTTEKAYTLTGSTLGLVHGLDKPLLIECYFSPKDKLTAAYRESRTVLDNFLDELVQVGKGWVVVQRKNPLDDKATADAATRIGIKPMDLPSNTSSSMSVERAWQGLRLVHGGEKQKVIEQIAKLTSWELESILTPAIKEVVTRGQRKIGFMEWPLDPQGRAPAAGWTFIRTYPDIQKRYQFQDVKDAEGALVPPEIDTLMLFRPKDLTDRQKYVIDQFVMRGGTLVVFADIADYQIGEYRTFNRMPVVFDAKDSTEQFLAQLLSYGIEVRPKIVADMNQAAMQPHMQSQGLEFLVQMNQSGGGKFRLYPYFFHSVAIDWAQFADDLARDQASKAVDPQLAEQYRKRFRPGIDSDEPLFVPFKQAQRGPGFYWPCPVDVRRKNGEPDLPEGITGNVMLWSSPVAMAEDPPPSANPFGGGDWQLQEQYYFGFWQKLKQRIEAEPRQQFPLMVQVKGVQQSWFAGKPRPKKPSEIKEEEARKEKEKAEAEAKAKAAAEGKDQPKDEANAKDQPPAQGPPPPPDEAAAKGDGKPKDQEPEPVTKGTKAAHLVVIGDSDFVRDDLLQQVYAQRGGPVSMLGLAFWNSVLDWLSQDQDLLALNKRTAPDRALRFVADELIASSSTPQEREQRVARKVRLVQWLNILLPVFILSMIGLAVFLIRRGQKHSFLQSVND
jgi:ABC-type uncharacterized transport system involved in gliding motility auxiliary subunit